MLGSFYAPQAKIGRARKHLTELETEIEAYLNSRPARFETNIIDEPGTRRFEFMLHLRQPGPLFSAILGDVIHNLRAALDVAMCDLVRWREGNPHANVGDVHFPICKRAKNLDSVIRKGALDRIGVEAVDIIRDLKPYPTGNPIFCGVHDLDVQDKHTTLVVALVSVGSPIIRRWDDDGTMNPTLIGDPTAPSELRVEFPAPGPFAGLPIIETLRECVGAVSSAVGSFRALANTT
jgi:hypothetical protein